MKTNVKAFGEFLNESEDRDELMGMGFNDELSSFEDIWPVLHSEVLNDPEVARLYSELDQAITAAVSRMAGSYELDPSATEQVVEDELRMSQEPLHQMVAQVFYDLGLVD